MTIMVLSVLKFHKSVNWFTFKKEVLPAKISDVNSSLTVLTPGYGFCCLSSILLLIIMMHGCWLPLEEPPWSQRLCSGETFQ